MSSTELDFSGGEYATVAERLEAFYARYPEGRVITELVSRTEHEVTFRARVYRGPADVRASATGWASERPGDGAVNEVACLENTETSAVGRALANLGFAASPLRPSAEEMAKVARERQRMGKAVSPVAAVVREAGRHDGSASPGADGRSHASADGRSHASADGRAKASTDGRVQASADARSHASAVADVQRLLEEAERAGMRPARAAAVRARLGVMHDEEEVAHIEAALRDYLARRLRERVGSALEARTVPPVARGRRRQR